ncbi:hypothetical protein PEp14_00036 [Erwinia phage PEp14]|uniref:Uncharacterized protein n=1 Tax=Erwinia phage PEp14 TaxID=1131315 RepID=H2DE66_9CAUD|nr:hypothetical protein PEp14_00036 [Erwinia phage PEp14]AEY69625.1 hypothetical protein PEp14_00036 [Erwinia phage PEp14]
MRRLPRLWQLLGVWYCGVPHPVTRVPLVPVFGSGSTPAEAYWDYVSTRWRTARSMVFLRKEARKAPPPGRIIVTSTPEPEPAAMGWFAQAFHRFKRQ